MQKTNIPSYEIYITKRCMKNNFYFINNQKTVVWKLKILFSTILLFVYDKKNFATKTDRVGKKNAYLTIFI